MTNLFLYATDIRSHAGDMATRHSESQDVSDWVEGEGEGFL